MNDHKRITPPYVPFKTFQKCLEKISGLRLEIISLDLLKGYGLSEFNAAAARQALQFLGIIDESGGTTEKFDMLRFTGDEYDENLRTIIEEAYAPLFQRLNMGDADKEDIFNMLIHTYGCSKRVATTATSLLIGMCELVGIRGTERPKTPRRTKKQKTMAEAVPQRTKTISKRVPEGPAPSLVINLNINIDAAAEKEDIIQIFNRISEAWEDSQRSKL